MAKGNWETIAHLAQGFSKNKVARIKNGVNFKIKKGEKYGRRYDRWTIREGS